MDAFGVNSFMKYLLIILSSVILVGRESPDHGLHFNGADSYVVIPDHESLDLTGDFTIEFWTKFDTVPHYSHILNKHQPGRNDDGSWVLKSGINSLSFAFSWPYIPYEIHTNVEETFHKNDWFHFAFCYLESANYFSFWINGDLKNEGFAEINIKDTDWPLYIGSEISYNYFKGLIAEIRFSNIVRYTSEFRPQPSFHSDKYTLAYWPCDEGKGAILNDLGPFGNHGKIVNGDWTKEETRINPVYLTILLAAFIGLSFLITKAVSQVFKKQQKQAVIHNATQPANHSGIQLVVGENFSIIIDGQQIDIGENGRHNQAEALMQFLAGAPELKRSHAEIKAELWSLVTEGSFVNSLNVTLTALRKLIAPYGKEIIQQNKMVALGKGIKVIQQ